MWLVENWFLVVAFVAMLGGVGVVLYKFAGMPTEKQIETIKEWLLYACIEAEKEFQGGTGQLKLRYVYDLFVARFPSFSKVVSFTMFSLWVKEALVRMEEVLKDYKQIAKIVEGGAK